MLSCQLCSSIVLECSICGQWHLHHCCVTNHKAIAQALLAAAAAEDEYREWDGGYVSWSAMVT